MMGERVLNVPLLQQPVPCVDFIPDYVIDVGPVNDIALAGTDAFFFYLLCHLLEGQAGEIKLEDTPYPLSFLRDYGIIPAIPLVAQQTVLASNEAAFCVGFPYLPFDVLTGGATLFLGKCRQKPQHEFPVHGEGVYLLPLEAHFHADVLQMAHRVQQVNGISGKTGDGFYQDDVDLASIAVGYHPLEVFPVLDAGAGYAIVCINPGIFPLGIALNEVIIVADLC